MSARDDYPRLAFLADHGEHRADGVGPAAARALGEIDRRRAEADLPNLGLATTAALLDEIRCRIDLDYFVGGGGLEYTTVHGRPDGGGDS